MMSLFLRKDSADFYRSDLCEIISGFIHHRNTLTALHERGVADLLWRSRGSGEQVYHAAQSLHATRKLDHFVMS